MPFQNYVMPTGGLIITKARGTLFGNRGALHNERREIVRPFRGTRWITCLLEFKGRRRTLMSPGQYTELFFLDEATALAAGHRPCAECRRDDFNRFRRAWADGQGRSDAPSAAELDEALHAERWDGEARLMRRWKARADELPDGAFVLHDGAAHRVRNGGLERWTPAGYDQPVEWPPASVTSVTPVTVLTPPSIVGALAAGY